MSSSSTATLTVLTPAQTPTSEPRPHQQNHVTWTPDTVDNEHMNKKKSKICCVFKKKRAFGEDSSDDDEDHGGHSCQNHSH